MCGLSRSKSMQRLGHKDLFLHSISDSSFNLLMILFSYLLYTIWIGEVASNQLCKEKEFVATSYQVSKHQIQYTLIKVFHTLSI